MPASGTRYAITGDPVRNMPWEDKPAGYSSVIWRSAHNPVIPRDAIPSSNSIFNSAVVPYQGKFAGVFRCDDHRRHMQMHRGFSDDGRTWRIDNEAIRFQSAFPDQSPQPFEYGYDPRVCRIEDRYYVTL